MPPIARHPLAVLALAALALTVRAGDGPVELAVLALGGPFGSVGDRVGVAGDVDGDGANEILVAGDSGVLTFDGATGALLDVLVVGGGEILNVAGLGDADADGEPDLVVADGISVRAFSRADGSLLWSHAGSPGGSIGWDLAILDDLDGDDVADLAAGEPDADPAGVASAGTIHVLSGASGVLLNQVHGIRPQDKYGRSLAAFGALDGRGGSALVMGHSAWKPLTETLGRVLVLDALDGSVLQIVANTVPTVSFGVEVAGLGDLDGDGLADLGVSSQIGFPLVQAYAGGSGDLIWTEEGSPSFKLISLGDLDGDGVPEVVAGSPGGFFGGSGVVIDGASGVVLISIPGAAPYFFLSAAAPGDLTGDGRPELVVGTAAGAGVGGSFLAEALALDLAPLTTLHHLSIPGGGTGLGTTLAPAGDHDGDGREDVVLVGATGLVVCSGATGALLADLTPPGATLPPFGAGLRSVVTVGDLDRDGVPDYAAGNPFAGGVFLTGPGRVQILSGASGAVLAERSGAGLQALGASLCLLPDSTGDGVPELLAGAPDTDQGTVLRAGALLLLSGQDLSLLSTIPGAGQPDGRFGLSLSADADLTGDGVPEIFVGSSEESPGFAQAGRARLLDGQSLALLSTVNGANASTQVLGRIVGDGDGDGVADLLTAESGFIPAGESGTRGRVRLWSGATHGLLWQALGPDAAGLFGAGFGGVGDVDGDGRHDVGAMNGAVGSGTVHVLSGADGSLLDAFDKQGPGAGGVLAAGHFDPGGCGDFLIGVPSLGGNGGARLYASSQGGVHGFIDRGHAKGGAAGPPRLDMTGDLGPGGAVTVALRQAPPLALGAWFIGLSAGNLPFKQGTLVPSPLGLFLVINLAANGAGEFIVTIANPAGIPPGTSLFSQFWFADPTATAGAAASNGIEEIFK